jgi:hypothetical protein
MEVIEGASELFSRHAAPRVGDCDAHSALAGALGGHGHAPGSRAEAVDRVAHEILEDAPED